MSILPYDSDAAGLIKKRSVESLVYPVKGFGAPENK